MMDGLSANISTFIPKMPVMKVSGRKMKVIQLRRQRLSLSINEWRASRMATRLYICRNISV